MYITKASFQKLVGGMHLSSFSFFLLYLLGAAADYGFFYIHFQLELRMERAILHSPLCVILCITSSSVRNVADIFTICVQGKVNWK